MPALARAPAGDCGPGTITTVAGAGKAGYSGDGGQAIKAALHEPGGLAVAPDGSLFIADTWNHRIRKVDPKGIITTVAGTGDGGYSGDGGPATLAKLKSPAGLGLAPDGTLYFADSDNNCVRKIDPAGVITTVAGVGGEDADDPRFAGDGGPAVKAKLYEPVGVAIATDGSLYIADSENCRVRKVDPRGIISTVAGNGDFEHSGDGGPATKAGLFPVSVAIGADGSLFIATGEGQRVRRVSREGVITTAAGDGWKKEEPYGPGRFRGDGGPAAEASFNLPAGLAIAADGSLYIGDMENHRVRKVDPEGFITTVAGDGWTDEDGQGRYTGDGGPAVKASLCGPSFVALAADGTLYIADSGNHRVRKVCAGRVVPSPDTSAQ